MSYTNKFTTSLAIRQRQEKQKQANNISIDNGGNGVGFGGGSSRVALKAATTLLNSTTTTSASANGTNTNMNVGAGKMRANKVIAAAAGSPSSPKPQSKPPLSSVPSLPSARRRPSASTHPLKTSVSIAQSPSDDYSGMLVLKKKPPSKSLPQQQQALNKYPSFNARSMMRPTKKEPIGISIRGKDNEKREGYRSSSSSRGGLQKHATSTSTTTSSAEAGPQKQQEQQQQQQPNVVHEGPMKISSDGSDLCKIISQAAAWKPENDESRMDINIDEEDNESLKDYDGDVEVDIVSDSDGGSGSQNTITSTVSSSYTVIKGGGQEYNNCNSHHHRDQHTTSTSGSSNVPSLTSPPSANNNSNGKGKEKMREIKVDSNNNIIESIKKTIFRSLGFYNVSGTHIRSDGRIDIARSSAILTAAVTADAATSSTGVDDGTDYTILNHFSSRESCNVDNNSIQSDDSSAYGIFVRGSDSVLIPLEIEEQLQRAFQFRTTTQEEQVHRRENRSFYHSSPSLRSPRSPNTVCSCLSAKGIARKMIDFKDATLPRTVAFKSSAPEKLSCDTWSQVNKEEEDEFIVSHTCNKGVSASSSHSHVSTASGFDETDLDEQTCNETQTSVVAVKDVEIGASESAEKIAETETKKKKLLNLVMAVNTGIHIDSVAPIVSAPTPGLTTSSNSNTATDQKKKSVKLKGIMKEARPATAHPTTSSRSSTPVKRRARKTNSTSAISEVRKRRKEKSRERKALAQAQNPTFAQVGADYGFPTGISITSLIENIMGLTWASENNKVGSRKSSKTKNSLKNPESKDTVVTIHDKERRERRQVAGGEESSLIGTAYDMLSAGLKFASGLIGNEEDLEPREDMIRYNGYTIRVCGRKLLLESLHVNCDFNIDTAGIYSQSARHSSEALGPHTLSRERLEEDCDGKRIRIVVRLNGPWSASSSSNSNMLLEEDDVGNSIIDVEKHSVSMAERKWTLIYGDNEELKEKVENFVEIACPIGVHPVSLVYGLLKGLLLIDAP